MQVLARLVSPSRGHARYLAWVVVLGLIATTLWPGCVLAADIWKDIGNDTWQSVYHVLAQDAYRVAQGYADGTFRPNIPVTRGQFAKMVVEGLGIPLLDPTTPTFPDVPRSSTFYRHIEGAYAAGVISGFLDGTFKPDVTLTRQQAYSILGRYLASMELAATGVITDQAGTFSSLQTWYGGAGAANLEGYADRGEIAAEHRAAAAYLVHMGVVLGSPSGTSWYLRPLNELNRAPAVAMILRTETKVLELTRPSITSLDPSVGPLAGGNAVEIIGKGFVGVTQVKFGAVPALSYTVPDGTRIVAVAPPSASATTVSVSVTARGGTSAQTPGCDYTYTAGPSVTGVTPSAGPLAGGNVVVITGSNFSGATAVLFGSFPAASFAVNSDTQITAQAPPHAAGKVDIQVVTPGGVSPNTPADDYTYVPAPDISSLDPTTGLTTGGNPVVIMGTNFVGVTSVTFGGVEVPTFTVDSSVQITATAPSHSAGEVVVRVTAAGGQTASGDEEARYTYVPAPQITQVTPPAGHVYGGNQVEILGSNLGEVQVVAFGDATVAPLSVSDSTVTVVVPPGAGAVDASVNVTVYTPLGSVTKPGAYRYLATPTIISVDPTTGSVVGGTTVTIRGEHFFYVQTVKFGDSEATVQSTSPDGWTIVVVTPAHSPGLVDITVETLGGEAVKPEAFFFEPPA